MNNYDRNTMNSYVTSNSKPEDIAWELDRAALFMDEGQYIREAQKNAEEAIAACNPENGYVEWGYTSVSVPSLPEPVLKALIADNGCGMSPEKLAAYMSTLRLNGRRDRGEIDLSRGLLNSNYGGGLKWSSLGHNTYGFVVVSKAEGHQPAAIRIYKDEEGLYQVQRFGEHNYMIVDPFDTINIPGFGSFRLADSVCKGRREGQILDGESWTVMVFGGKSAGERTLGTSTRGDRTNSLTPSNAYDYLNSKFLRPAVKTRDVHPRTGGHRETDSRYVEGALSKFEDSIVTSGVEEGENGILFHWMFDTTIDLKGSAKTRLGTVSIACGNEVIEHFTLSTGARAMFDQFGIWARKAHKAFALIIEIPEISSLDEVGVFMSSETRNNLKWSDGTGSPARGVPYEDLGRSFAEHLPKEIKDFLHGLANVEDDYDEDYEKFFEDLSRKLGLDQLNKAKKPVCIDGQGEKSDCNFTPDSESHGGRAPEGGGDLVEITELVTQIPREDYTGPVPSEDPTKFNQGIEKGTKKGTSRRSRRVAGTRVRWDDGNMDMPEEVLMQYIPVLDVAYLNPSCKGLAAALNKMTADCSPDLHEKIGEYLRKGVLWEATYTINKAIISLNDIEVSKESEFGKATLGEAALTMAVLTSSGLPRRVNKWLKENGLKPKNDEDRRVA